MTNEKVKVWKVTNVKVKSSIDNWESESVKSDKCEKGQSIIVANVKVKSSAGKWQMWRKKVQSPSAASSFKCQEALKSDFNFAA